MVNITIKMVIPPYFWRPPKKIWVFLSQFNFWGIIKIFVGFFRAVNGSNASQRCMVGFLPWKWRTNLPSSPTTARKAWNWWHRVRASWATGRCFSDSGVPETFFVFPFSIGELYNGIPLQQRLHIQIYMYMIYIYTCIYMYMYMYMYMVYGICYMLYVYVYGIWYMYMYMVYVYAYAYVYVYVIWYMYMYMVYVYGIYIYRGIIATYNNLCVTSLEWLLVRGIIPKWPYFNCAQVVFLHKARWNLPSPFKMYHHGQIVVSSSWWGSTNMFRYALFHLNIWDADDNDDDDDDDHHHHRH